MNKLISIFKKEILDNIRDRRSLFFAVFYGPVLLPLIIAVSMFGSYKQFAIDFEEISELPVINAELAPNLVDFLYKNNIDVITAPENYEEALRESEIEVVLKIEEDYGEKLSQGKPAPLTLYSNDADKESGKAARKISTMLNAYERTIDSLRMQTRGIDPDIFNSISVDEVDVSEGGLAGQMISSLFPFLLIMSMVTGGFYLAIDTTAGERERNSLEPLLSLPIKREFLVFGKYLALVFFITISAVLTVITLSVVFNFMPTEVFAGTLHFDPLTLFTGLLLASPLILLIGSLLMSVAAFTRSTKEAQTFLGILMVLPMAPFFLLQFMNIKSANIIMLMPMMSQYKLLEKAAKNESIESMHILLSFAGTLGAAALLLMLAFWLYRQDRILQ